MKNSILRNIGFGLLSALLLTAPASAQEGKATLAVSSIKPTRPWQPQSSRTKKWRWDASLNRWTAS